MKDPVYGVELGYCALLRKEDAEGCTYRPQCMCRNPYRKDGSYEIPMYIQVKLLEDIEYGLDWG